MSLISFQCNNPRTKEPKLQAAMRIVPEWIDYDNEVKSLWDEVNDKYTTMSYHTNTKGHTKGHTKSDVKSDTKVDKTGKGKGKGSMISVVVGLVLWDGPGKWRDA